MGSGGISDHCPIFLELRGRRRKPPSPFKFNPSWLKEDGFHRLVKELWVSRPHNSVEFAGAHFHSNLKRLKEATISWAHAKRVNDDQILRECELAIGRLLQRPGLGFMDELEKEELSAWEHKRNVILCEREELWR